MSGMARVLAKQGVAVTGSDLRESATLESLRRESGIRADAGHEAAHLNGATLVVASAAVKKDNPGDSWPPVPRASRSSRGPKCWAG